MRCSMLKSLILISLLMLAGACGRGVGERQAVDTLPPEPQTLSADMTAEALVLTDSLLATMSVAEKAGQCFMPTILSGGSPADMKRLGEYIDSLHVGGVVLLKGDLEGALRMSVAAHKARVPLFVAIDAEWGLGMRLADAPIFPRNGNLDKAIDEEWLFDYGAEVARECRLIGVNMVLGPCMDVLAPEGGFIGTRSFGEDPERVALLGVAYSRGVESGGVISVSKHFPGHGSPRADSHRQLPVIKRSLHELDSVDLSPFRAYIDAGLTAVMMGHLAVPAVDPQSLPAAVSPAVIQDLLRDELGFNGLVLTDALNMGGAEGYGAVAALKAGADIVIGPADTRSELRSVIEAVGAGELPEATLDERCRRILFCKVVRGIYPASEATLRWLHESMALHPDSLRREIAKGERPLLERLQNQPFRAE